MKTNVNARATVLASFASIKVAERKSRGDRRMRRITLTAAARPASEGLAKSNKAPRDSLAGRAEDSSVQKNL